MRAPLFYPDPPQPTTATHSIMSPWRHLVDSLEMPANPELRLKVIDAIARGLSPKETILETGISNGGYHKLKKNPTVISEVARRKKEIAQEKTQKKSVDRPAVSVAVEVVDGPAYRGPGQPSKMTPETKKTLWEVIRAGGNESDACAMAMISYRTFIHWIQIAEGRLPGRQPTEEYLLFLREYKIAMAQRNAMLVGLIRKAAVESTIEKYDGEGNLKSKEKKSGDYRAALALLERSISFEKADTLEKAKAMFSDAMARVYSAIAASSLIPDDLKPVIFEVIGTASGDEVGGLAEG